MGGTPALEQDSIHSLFSKLPLMVVLLITTTTILMFLAFGSLVLPIKAALMSALTLGSTMGVLTWIFVDGHFSHLLNFTPQPLMAPMIGLIIAVIYGLSTDYEVFLVSRMVEARERGMSTAEAIRIGTATTGRLITAAALILAVVAGAFAFSDLVMMKYLAFGLLIALLLDATVIRMFLVPAIMKLLGDDCWWAPRWMKRLQERLGLGELDLPDERKRPAVREPEEALVGAGAPVRPRPMPPHDPTHPAVEGSSRPGATARIQAPPRANAPSVAGTTRMPSPRTAPADEPPTTRLSMAKNAVRNVVNNATAATQRTSTPVATAGPGSGRGTAARSGPRPGGSRNRVVAGRIAGHQPGRPAGATAASAAVGGRHPCDSAGRSEATRGSDAEQRQRTRPQGDDATTAMQRPAGPRGDRKDQHREGDDERKPRRRCQRPGPAAARGPALAALASVSASSSTSSASASMTAPSSASRPAASASGSRPAAPAPRC